MRLARIEMIFQREEEIALKVLKYSTGTMRRWGIDIRGRTKPPRAGAGVGAWWVRGERCGATGGFRDGQCPPAMHVPPRACGH